MDEAEWLECIHPEYMVPILRGKESDRKLRMLSVAVCQKIAHLMANEESLHAILVAERFANGEATEQERVESEISAQSVREAAFDRWDADYGDETPPAGITYWAARAAAAALMSDAHEGLREVISSAGLALEWSEDESLVAGPAYWGGIELTGPWPQLIRDVIGNPFRPICVDPSWQMPRFVKLAQTIYDKRDFGRMPNLADALESGGCTNQEVLGHCRQSDEHVRGCWVVDLILGKE